MLASNGFADTYFVGLIRALLFLLIPVFHSFNLFVVKGQFHRAKILIWQFDLF